MKRTQRILAKEMMELRNKILENCKYSSKLSESLIEFQRETSIIHSAIIRAILLYIYIARIIDSINEQNEYIDTLSILNSSSTSKIVVSTYTHHY